MPAVRHPAPMKALLLGAFFIWADLAQQATADEPAEAILAVDGDTVLLRGGAKVRVVGVNAPELGKDGAPDQPLAREAQRLLQQLVARQKITLEFEGDRRDHYGRLLAHIRLADGRDPAEQLLEKGLACAIAIPPNVARFDPYLRLEAKARARRLGIWGNSYFRPIPASRLDAQQTGFRFVTGKIARATRSRYGHYLWLSEHFALHVPHADAKQFPRPLAQLVGRSVSVRGWITAKNGNLRMKVQHPGMLQVLERASVRENSYYSPLPYLPSPEQRAAL